MNLVKLPSGCFINADKITHAREYGTGIMINIDGSQFPENMSMEELDALLNPPTTAIVSPVLDLDRLKVGAACQFTHNGKVKHGILHAITSGLGAVPILGVTSDGEEYVAWTDGVCTRGCV